MARVRQWLPWLLALLVMSTALSALDMHGAPMSGWLGYFGLNSLCGILLWLAWRWVARGEGPRWMLAALGVALFLRLAVGIGLTYALPAFGYDNPPHRAGYVFYDAYRRDNDARVLAQSDRPLIAAFTDRAETDQYGGLLFISAGIYRLLTPNVHRPLMVVTLAATVSSLAVLFTWAFVRMTFGEKPGSVAAWIVALYPEAILLGASQMREPFIGTALALGLYGYARLRIGSIGSGVLAIGLATVLGTLLSPPYGVMIAGVVLLAWLWEGRVYPRQTGWALLLLGLGGLGAFLLTVRSWSAIPVAPQGNFLDLLSWWLSAGARYQLYVLEWGSGMVQSLFSVTPQWAHMPMATAYGLVRPFLPAALTEESAPLARAIYVWRSLGWFAILPFLIYAPFAVLRGASWRGLSTYLVFIVWGGALLASYRAGGDDWDNVRYRAVLLSAQAALAGWAWLHASKTRSPWLRRTGVLVGGVTFLFLQWYAGRYFGTPRLDLWGTLAAVGIFVAVFLIGMLVMDGVRRRRLTAQGHEV